MKEAIMMIVQKTDDKLNRLIWTPHAVGRQYIL